MAWRRERRRNRFSHVLPSSSIAACAGDAGEAVSSPSAAAAAFALDACCCTGAGSVRHGARGWFRSPRGMGLVPFATGHGGRFRSPRGMGAGSVRRQRRQQPLPRRGDRAEDAWPRPLHSPALRQPRPPLRGSLAHARFPGTGRHSLLLTAPFRRRPVGSSRNRALPRRTRMALPAAAAFFLFNKCLMAEGSVEKLQRTPNQF